jgi:glycerol-3-phosphate acyltransferase PlsX
MNLETTIAVDAMTAEAGIDAVVRAATSANERCPSNIVLVGQKEKFAEYYLDGLSLYPASEVIGMDEEPSNAVRLKRDASVVVAANLVKRGEANVMVSPGNTGASVAAALCFRRLKGIKRPAIATTFPTMTPGKYTIMIDSGANSDITKYTPEILYQFAVMGSEFSRYLFGTDSPEVGLANVGEESYKGSELVREGKAV